MATPTPSTNTPQKHLLALSSPAPRSVPPTSFDSPHILSILNDGGIGMGISLSGIGNISQLGLSQLGRGDENERRRRLESIIHMLKARPGRVGEEGIIALCKKEGIHFDRTVEANGNVGLTLVIGEQAICDITLKKEEVVSVKLELASDEEGEFKDSGSRILFKSLTPSRPGQSRINLMLDQFAGNLDKLLQMDRLSADNGGVQCYKAISALHGSLRRLFEHEKKIALALIGDVPDANHKAEREVLCKKSGRPRMNAGTCLGLSLEYWMDRRHLISKKGASPKGKEKQAFPNSDEYPEDANPDLNKIYSLTIECEASPSSMYTPIRIPTSWISDKIEASKPPDGPDPVINNILNNTSTIEWLDPKPTYLDSPTATGDHDAMNIDNAPGRLPNIRFVARFNPPLVVPLSLYASIVDLVGLQCPEPNPTTFVGLAIRPDEPDPGSNAMAGVSTIEISSTRQVLSVDKDGNETLKTHNNSLYVPKLEFSRTLESLPFQHPRQLVELLPMLRPYAFTTSLLQRTFVEKKTDKTPSTTTTTLPPTSKTTPPSPPPTPIQTPKVPLQLDVSLAYLPGAPRLILTIPHPSSSTNTTPPPPNTTTPIPSSSLPTNPSDLLSYLLSPPSLSLSSSPPPSSNTEMPPLKIALDISGNGDVFIQEQNLFDAGADADADVDVDADPDAQARIQEAVREKVKRVGRALDVCGDLNVFGEWVRREVEIGG